jgi:hypothetical protein
VLIAFRFKSQAIDMPPMPAGKEGVARKIYARKESSGHYIVEKSSAYELPKLLFPASGVRPPIGGFLLDRTSDWVLGLETLGRLLGHSHCVAQPAFAASHSEKRRQKRERIA